MSFTYQQLHDEIVNDPTGVGYAADVTAGSDGNIATKLNTVGSTQAYVVNREPIASATFTALIDLTEFSAGTQAQRDYLGMIVAAPTVDLNNAVVKAALTALFSAAAWPNTRARMSAALTRQGSRAEVLWGTGVAVGAGDVSHVLRST